MEQTNNNHDINTNKPIPPKASGEPVFRSAAVSAVIQQPPGFAVQSGLGGPKQIPTLETKIPSSILHWRWRNPRITPVGLYYPLGPCQIRLPLGILGSVLDVLPDAFRRLSLQASYVDTPISATCRSLEQVEFQVSIFAGLDNLNEMVVEIDRKDGDVISYHYYANQVVRAITGAGQISSVCGQEPVAPCFWNRSVLGQAETIKSVPTSGASEALETTFGLMTMGRLDAQRLGFESMIHMTDPYKCGLSVAEFTSKALLRPNNVTQQRVSDLVFHFACEDHSENPCSNVAHFGDFRADDFTYLALIIVCQALQIAASSKTIDMGSFLNACPENLVERILDKVHQAHSRPHEAYYAVQTLMALCESVPSLRARINNRDVEEAQHYGDSCHLALATASHKLLLSLQA